MRAVILALGVVGLVATLLWTGAHLRSLQASRQEISRRQATHAALVRDMIEIEGFVLDRTEVTVERYRACVEAGACTEPGRSEQCNWGVEERDAHPINCVNHAQATAYCAWTGRRLPSAKEWELAACGRDGRTFAWPGPDIDGRDCFDRDTKYALGEARRIESEAKGTCPVEAHPKGATERGVLGLGGNVCEWTSTEVGTGWPPSNRWANFGPTWASYANPRELTCSGQSAHAPTHESSLLGFRCAWSEPPSVWRELWDSEIQLGRSSTTAMP
jgi:formylglycine-generating enzyme required for sulfatase activity